MITLGVVAYGLASAGFLLLTLLLATSWEGRAQGARLIVACGVTTAWAALLAYAAWSEDVAVALIVFAEAARDAAWLVTLSGLIERSGLPAFLSRVAYLLGGAAVLVAGMLLGAEWIDGESRHSASVLITGGLLLSLTALVMLEQVYRNANPAGRYTLKYLVIGVGVIYAYDLFLFSQAQLLKGIEAASWEARGLVHALTVPLIALAARANPQWSLRVFVSRQVVFYTTSLVAVGGYFLLMALGGYVIRLYGGTWGRIAQLVFFAGAGIVLAILLASPSLRGRFRVFLSKHFYRNKYDYRIEWLRFIATLSSQDAQTDVRANSVRAIAQIINSPAGRLFMKVDDGPDYLGIAAWSRDGWANRRIGARTQSGADGETWVARAEDPVPADSEFAEYLARTQWVVDMGEYRRSPDVYQNVTLPDFILVEPRWGLVVPLMQDAELLGFVVLAEPSPFEPTYEDRDLLKTVGRHVATHLAQHEADRRLAESRQFEAYHRLTAFVMHDLKNLAAQLSLLVANAEKHKHNPEFIDDAVGTIANSTMRMQRLIEQLQRREVHTLNRRMSLAEVARDACARCRVRQPEPACEFLDEEAWVEADRERLTMVVEHVIRNAQEASESDGSVKVGLSREGSFVDLTVADTGSGMSDDFIRNRLFKPFDTTKGSKGMGIGAYQVREYLQSIGGQVEVHSAPGQGTRFALRLPAVDPPAEGKVPPDG